MHQQNLCTCIDILLNIILLCIDSWFVEFKWVVEATTNCYPFDHHQRMDIVTSTIVTIKFGSIVCCLLPSKHRFSCELLCMIYGSLNIVATTKLKSFLN